MTTILPRSRIIGVQFELALPVDANTDEVLEWVRFNLLGGTLSTDNPLNRFDVEALSEPTLTDTPMHLHEEALVHVDGRSTIRRWREPKPFTGRPAMDQIAHAREAGR